MAIQPLCNCSLNSDLKLVDPLELAHCCSSLNDCVKSKEISSENSFESVFGYDVNFYYIIEQIENETVINYERGIGCIYKKDNHTYLNRKLSFATGKNAGELYPNRTNVPFPFKCYNDHSNIVLYSSLPPTYLECLAAENSVLCSSSPCLPNVVSLDNDSFLGRFDSTITSVSFSDSRLVDKIAALICKFTKQLKLKTSKLSLNRVETNMIDLVPSSDVKAKIGTLYYDEESDSLKLYTKNGWRTIP